MATIQRAGVEKVEVKGRIRSKEEKEGHTDLTMRQTNRGRHKTS